MASGYDPDLVSLAILGMIEDGLLVEIRRDGPLTLFTAIDPASGSSMLYAGDNLQAAALGCQAQLARKRQGIETADDRAKARGLRVYDWALPQGWWDEAHDRSGENPAGHVVWCYDEAPAFGTPRAVDELGDSILALMDGA